MCGFLVIVTIRFAPFYRILHFIAAFLKGYKKVTKYFCENCTI